MTRRVWLLLCAGMLHAALAAPIETIPLHHRPAADLLPLLRPHLWPGEALSGQGFQLLLSAPPPRAAALRAIVRELDTPPVPIRIRLRLGGPGERPPDGGGGSQVLDTRPGSTHHAGRVETLSTEDPEATRRSWVIRAVTGRPVHIETGIDFPYPALGALAPSRDGQLTLPVPGLRYRPLRSGFLALVRLHRDRVVVDIAARLEALLDGIGGETEQRTLHTRVTGRLGEWIDLGGTGRTAQRTPGRSVLHTREAVEDTPHFWLRVDRIQ